MAKDEKLTVDEENEQKAMYAGVLKRDIIRANEAIGKQKAESSEASGNLSAAMNLFEKNNGNKKAMKAVAAWSRMEPADFSDFWRCVLGYGKVLELFDEDGNIAQADMFDQQQEQQKNADSISAATAKAKATTAKPSMGLEAVN